MWRKLLAGGLAVLSGVALASPLAGTAAPSQDAWAPTGRALAAPSAELLPPVGDPGGRAAEALTDLPSAGRVRVPTADPVHRTLAWLEIVTQDNESISCSGTIVGDGAVLTAAHCIAGAKSVRVVPGKDGPSEPWGSQYGASVSVPSGWGFGLPADYAQYDIGLVILPDRLLTNKTGTFPGLLSAMPAGAFRSNATEVAALGYPGECVEVSCSREAPITALNGTFAWALHAGFARADESFIYPDFPGSPGMSGAPIIRERDLAIVGIVDSALFITTQGMRINGESREFLQTACGSYPVCSITFANPWFRLALPGIAGDTQATPPALTGQALSCAKEIAFVDAFTEKEIKFAHSMRGLLEMDIDPAMLLDPNLKALFAQQVGAAVGDALEVKALESPDARFDAFHDSLDAGIDDILAGLVAINDAMATGNLVSMLAAIQALGEANLHIMAAQGQYPSIDPVCQT
jgi:hypothetical protein